MYRFCSALILTVLLLLSGSFAFDVHAAPVTISSWQTSDAFSFKSHPVPSFAIGQYYYVLREGSVTDLYYAKQANNGSLVHPDTGATSGIWKSISPSGGYGSSPHGTTAVSIDGSGYYFRNGHIIRAEQNSSNGVLTQIYELENPSQNGFDGEKYVWNSAVYTPFSTGQGYVFHFGGFDFGAYTYKQDIFRRTLPFANMTGRSDGNNFSDTGKDSPFNQPGKAAFYQIPGQGQGFIYLRDGKGNGMQRIQVNADGSLGNWSQIAAIPSGNGNGRGDIFVIDNTLFAISGSKVFNTEINSAGDISGWDDAPPDLPDEQIDEHWGGGNTEGASYGVIGNYIYVTGKRNVYYAQINGAAPPTATTTPQQCEYSSYNNCMSSSCGQNNGFCEYNGTCWTCLAGNTPTPTSPPVNCQARILLGDFNCDMTTNLTDFDMWKGLFLKNSIQTPLSHFEYWRREHFK